jgi:hypothetical protein
MRRRVLLTLLAVVALAWLAVGGGDDDGAAAGADAPLSGPELRWLRGYARWAIELEEADLSKRAVRASFADCAAVLRTTAGRAPTARLARAQAAVDDACVSLTSGVGGTAVQDELGRADELLWPLLLSASSLPEHDEATSTSRSSPSLGALAGAHAGADVEVLCWSERDWRRLIREENAWWDSQDDPLEIDGLAQPEVGRIHMLLADCNLLGRLRGERFARRSREGLIDAVYALSVLSHELQHFRLPNATEAEVECAGARALTAVGRDLGLDAAERALLPGIYAESVRPDLPDEYRRRCRGS